MMRILTFSRVGNFLKCVNKEWKYERWTLEWCWQLHKSWILLCSAKKHRRRQPHRQYARQLQERQQSREKVMHRAFTVHLGIYYFRCSHHPQSSHHTTDHQHKVTTAAAPYKLYISTVQLHIGNPIPHRSEGTEGYATCRRGACGGWQNHGFFWMLDVGSDLKWSLRESRISRNLIFTT